MLPSADVAIVALTNATPSGVPETLTAQFADLVQFGEVREDWWTLYHNAFVAMEQPEGSLVGQQPPADPAPPAPLGELRRRVRQRLLGSRAGDGARRRPAVGAGPQTGRPADSIGTATSSPSRFVTENAPPGTISKATFDGDKLTLEYYDDEHDGVFLR